MLESQVTQEQLESIVDRTIQEADLDNDDAISFEEFRKVKDRIMHSTLFMRLQSVSGLWDTETFQLLLLTALFHTII